MSDRTEASVVKWGTFIFAAIGCAMMFATLFFGGGGFFSDTRGGIARLEEQQKTMQVRLDQIVDRIDKGPRSDQLQDLIKTNSEQDGRINAMRDSYERRMSAMEVELRGLQVQLQSIQVASGRKLPGER